MDGHVLPIVNGVADLVAGPGAVGAAVVGGEGTAVVVAEFYDDDVVRFHRVNDGGEEALDCVGASAGAGYGAVDYGDGERVGEEGAPAWLEVVLDLCQGV